jgi:plasmid maintenance system antidote protein VapI
MMEGPEEKSMTHIPGFGAMVGELIAHYAGTKQALASAIGITASSLSHLLHAATASTVVCLRLSKVTHTSPGKLLRAAGKGDIAELLEDLYGPARRVVIAPPTLDPMERELLATYRRLDTGMRTALWRILRYTAGDPGVAPAGRRSRPRREAG